MPLPPKTLASSGQLLATSGAARALGRSEDTVRRWADEGVLRFYLDSNGRRLFSEQDLAAVRRKPGQT